MAGSGLIRLADRVAPGVAATAVAKAFSTIPAPPPEADRKRVIEHGEAFQVDRSGSNIRGELWGGGPHVHLVHGWAGWHQQLGAHVTPLLESGHQVLAHDALGHGESDPGPHGRATGTIVDLATSLSAVAAAHGPVAGVIAHSAGAMATLRAMLRGLTVQRLVLIAPSLSLTSTMASLRRRYGIGQATTTRTLDRLSRRFDLIADDFELVDVAARLPSPPPLLVIHDVDDPETPIGDARALVSRWPGARLVETTGRGHRRVIWAPETVAATADFFSLARGRGPVGARDGE